MSRKVALDLHRRSVYVLVEAAGQEVLRRRCSTDAAGEAALLALLQPGDRVALEATGGAQRLANRLEAGGAEVVLLDPQALRGLGFRGKKTDYRDCRALLRALDDPEAIRVWRPDQTLREIRQLTRERFAFNQGIVRLKNRVRSLLAEEGLQPPAAPWTPAGQQWLAEQTLPGRTRRILERELAVIAVEEALKEEQERELAALAREREDCQRLLQVVGFGPALAVMWVGEVGDLSRFPTSKELVSYAGLNPAVHQSGEHVSYGPITKAGRSQLRWIMVEVAWRHVQSGGPEGEHFHRLVRRGKLPQVAIVALARRLLVLGYTLLRRQENVRGLDLARYEQKLTRLAATRPASAEPEACDRDWAADRVERLTGQQAPRRAAGCPRRLRPRRAPRAPAAAEACRDPAGRRHGRGSTDGVPAEGGATPQPEACAMAPPGT